MQVVLKDDATGQFYKGLGKDSFNQNRLVLVKEATEAKRFDVLISDGQFLLTPLPPKGVWQMVFIQD